jgi:ribonucleoside-diphosphate reductase beta chain
MPLIGKKNVIDGTKVSRRESVFKDLYTKQKQAVWFPEEINIQQDINDYQGLSEEEKNLFHQLVAYFTTTELLVQNVLGESFYPYVVDPRAKMSMTVQMFMEDIHSDFFEIILNSFNLDHEELYKIADNNPIIKRKQEMVAHYANQISISQGGVDPDSLEGKKAILMAILINNVIQEGTWFYSGFALFFSMREKGLMTNICNGIDLVLIDESLHMRMGVEMILTMIEENPEIVQDEAFVANVQKCIVDGTELELEFLREILGTRQVFGLSYNEMETYLKYITDRRLEELGFAPHYLIENNPLKFLEKQDLMTLQNFFETTPNQYTNF